MTFDAIIKDLKNKIYHPVYFLQGDESYYIDIISDYIEKHVLNDGEKEFNQTILYGKDVDVATVLSHAKRFPMMSNYQVIIIKEAQDIKNLIKKTDKEGKDVKDDFLNYVDHPLKSTLLVFCYKYGSLDKRTKLSKTIDKQGVLFESKRLYDSAIPDWVNVYASKSKYKISPKAVQMIADYLGTDLSKIANELDKLMLNIPATETINEKHIEQFIGISKDYNIFELTTALSKKDVLKANRIVNYFGANPKLSPFVLTIGMLHNYFIKLLKYHSLADKSRNNAAAELGVPAFFMGEYELAARNYPMPKLIRIFNTLREYDLKSKGVDTTGIEDGELLKELIFKILH
ncbi:MAG: DNA polymerase III subunit delta [Bacteroidota bacterium]